MPESDRQELRVAGTSPAMNLDQMPHAFDDDLALLEQHTPIHCLKAGSARVATGGDGRRLGWINRA